ncbi:MAG: anthranilate phosphoribosyltransferase [Candidatus Gracilibacteria bacterium]|jgi:anthranilate synthase/phosphoribosyltransferase
MKTLIIDNFDSFTYNLYQLCHELNGNPEVHRNNKISIENIKKEKYTHIILSPGPGEPGNKRDFGICADVINYFSGKIPLLGVCLGHQGIINEFGGKVIRAPLPVHGKQSQIKINSEHALFKNLPEKISVMRYHSLIGEKSSLPKDLQIIAETKDGLIMAISHKKFPVFGVQFHPESIGTPEGKLILENFLKITNQQQKKSGKKHDVTESTKKLFDDMIDGQYSQNEIADILSKLAQKGESIDEITGAVMSLKNHAINLGFNEKDLMDTCGTGGSGLPRMNVSTTVAFVLAACGVKIAKHGNRAASGRCGSFDLLEGLGINIQLNPEKIKKMMSKLGIVFLYAPAFHPAMKIFMPIRKQLGFRTIFNVIGPLINPANPEYQLLGTNKKATAEKLISVLQKTGSKRAMVVTSENGLDEVTLHGKTYCFELADGEIKKFIFQPEDLGIKSATEFAKISGGDLKKNIEYFHLLLQGKAPESLQNLLLINCAFGLYVRGLSKSIPAGLEMAKATIKSGKAYQKFLDYKEISNE